MYDLRIQIHLSSVRRIVTSTFCALGLAVGAEAQVGSNYCTANPNSTGVTASITASGSADVSLNNLVLACDDLPLQTFGFFVVSRLQGFLPNPSGSAGNVCLGSPIGRYSTMILNAGLGGSVSMPVDLGNVPSSASTFAVLAGDTLNFQYWHRDITAGGAPTSNFSDGLEVLFTNSPSGPSFANDVYPLLDTMNAAGFSCTGCHGGTCGLDLSTPALAYTGLVNVAAQCCPGATYVLPNNSAGSLLYTKLTATPQCGNQMPLVGTFPGDINVVRDWIDAGALNN